METSDALLHGDVQLLPHDGLGRVFGELEVVDARHDTRQVVISGQGCLVRLAHNRQRWVQSSEAYIAIISDANSRHNTKHTAYWQSWTSGDELEVAAASRQVELGHDLEQVMDRTTLDIEAMVSLQNLT